MEKTYHCEKCGGILVFDVESQALKCPNCETVTTIEKTREVEEKELSEEAFHSSSEKDTLGSSQTMECSGCGAVMEIEASCTAVQCPYCGSAYVLAEKQLEGMIPDGMIPFQIDRQKVGMIFQSWIKKRWFAPEELKHLYQQDKLQGVYLPYWTFDAKTEARYSAMGGRNRSVERRNSKGEREQEIVTDWYFTSGHLHRFFDDILEQASDKMDPSLLKKIEPFHTKENVPYSPDYTAGFLAEHYTVGLEEAHKEAKREMKRRLEQMAREEVLKSYDRVDKLRVEVSFKKETYKHILLPVYSTAYAYKGKKYTVLVNGQTGEIQGDYPKSPVKIGAAIAAAVIIAIVLFSAIRSEASAGQAGIRTAEGWYGSVQTEEWKQNWLDYIA